MNRQEIIDLLQNNTCLVTFKKKDETERRMLCTLQPNVIPIVKGTGVKKTDDVISVFDIEKEDWRSFRVDSVISVV